MATQDKHPQDSILNDAYPQTIYELLIYDNKKLASKTDGPHIIMRRSVRDQEEPVDAELLAEETESSTESDSGLEVNIMHDDLEEEGMHEKDEASDIVGAKAISSYIASLAHHVESDVLRVVEAITDLENVSEEHKLELSPPYSDVGSDEAEEMENMETIEEKKEEGKVCLIEAIKEQDLEGEQPEQEKESVKKKGLDISEIFKSLKGARKSSRQKSYSYTKKVEYEDR